MISYRSLDLYRNLFIYFITSQTFCSFIIMMSLMLLFLQLFFTKQNNNNNNDIPFFGLNFLSQISIYLSIYLPICLSVYLLYLVPVIVLSYLKQKKEIYK